MAALAILLSAPAAAATALVGIQAPDALIIAGDSRGNMIVGGQVQKISDHICKVHVVARAVFGMAGIEEDVKGAFSSKTAVLDILRRRTSLRGAAQAIVNELKPKMLTLLQRLRTEDPASFSMETAKEGIVDILIGEIEKDGPAMLRVILKPVTVGGLLIAHEIRRPCAAPCQKTLIFPLGVIKDEDLDRVPYSPPRPLTAYAQSLVESKIGHPQVGGPVDVVRLDSGGHEWIKRKLNCRAEE